MIKKLTKHNFRVFAAAMSGHVLEFYDFTIFAVFSAVIGALYFPNSSELNQILASLSIYAAGFFMRPVGGVIFGHIGDRYGRRIALMISVSLMAVATMAVAFLPTYHSIGVLAPIALMLLRFIQGICVGGDGVGSSIFVLEHISTLSRGVIGGIVNAALTLGILLALMSGLLLNYLYPGSTEAWRLAFAAGGVFGFFGLYLRLKISETPVFEKLEKANMVEKLPIKKVFAESLNSCILTMACGALTGSMAYIVMVYINVFLKVFVGYSELSALLVTSFANICLIILLPIFGRCSDKFGYEKQMEHTALATIMLSVPLYYMLATGHLWAVLLASFGFAVLVAAVYSPLYPFIIELFTPEQRYSGIACSLNIGIALLGGTCAVFSIQLINITNVLWSPALYISAICCMFLLVNRYCQTKLRASKEREILIGSSFN